MLVAAAAERWGVPTDEISMQEGAWEGRSLGEICAQMKDPASNGGRSLAELHEHDAHDGLVGWGWHPGEGREPAPGDHETFAR